MLNVKLEKIRKLLYMYLSRVRYGHYQLVSESENFIHPEIHNIVSLYLISGVSIQPGKNHKINAICTNTTIFEEKIPDQIRALERWFHSLVVFLNYGLRLTTWS